MAKMLPRPPAPKARGYLVGPTARQLNLSRTNVGIGGGLPVSQSRRSSDRAVNAQQRTSLGSGITNTKKDVVTAKPQAKSSGKRMPKYPGRTSYKAKFGDFVGMNISFDRHQRGR